MKGSDFTDDEELCFVLVGRLVIDVNAEFVSVGSPDVKGFVLVG